MPRDSQINTFEKGLNADIGKSKFDPTQYIDANNVRIISRDNNSSFELTNVEGNKYSFRLPDYFTMYGPKKWGAQTNIYVDIIIDSQRLRTSLFSPDTFLEYLTEIRDYINNHSTYSAYIFTNRLLIIDLTSYEDIVNISVEDSTGDKLYASLIGDNKIIGSANILDETVLFGTDSNDEDPTTSRGILLKLTYDNAVVPTASLSVIYEEVLNFSSRHRITAVGRYEKSSIKKVYWVDGYNYLRFIDIESDSLYEIDPSELDIIGDHILTKPGLLEITDGGSLQSGMIQYAYTLYNKNGNETNMSPCSDMVHLVSSDDFREDSDRYYGEIAGEDTGKTVYFTIGDLDSKYDSIKVYSIHWGTLIDEPTINLITNDQFGDNTSYSITDDGSLSLGTMTLAEFVAESLVIKPNCIASKDNILFTANTIDEAFEIDNSLFDARAYRFPDTSAITVVDGTNVNVSNLSSIDDEADGVNTLGNGTAKYQANSSILGGTGLNVSYQFKLAQIQIDVGDYTTNVESSNEDHVHYDWTSLLNLSSNNSSFGSYASPFHSGMLRGYMRGEIYRFGIVFYNIKGQKSFVKWIGDIMMPNVWDADDKVTYYTDALNGNVGDSPKKDFATTFQHDDTNEVYANILYPEFSVTVSSELAKDISGYSIVRVKREEKDRTVYMQGVVNPTYNVNGGHYSAWNLKGTSEFNSDDYNYDLVNFYSPEVSFNNTYKRESGDTLDFIGTSDEIDNKFLEDPPTTIIHAQAQKTKELIPLTDRTNKIIDVEHAAITKRADNQSVYDHLLPLDGTDPVNEYVIGSWHYDHIVYYNIVKSFAGKCLTIDLENELSQDGLGDMAAPLSKAIICNYRKEVARQYGGDTYSNRSYNEYIYCGSYRSVNVNYGSTKTENVFGGDTFVAYFDCLRTMWNDIDFTTFGNGRYFNNFMIPLETSINLELRSDKDFTALYDETYNVSDGIYKIQETVEQGIDLFTSYLQDATDLYIYNTVYSKEGSPNTYFPKPITFDNQSEFPVRVNYSETKISGELVDSWTKFLANNFRDVDGNYGEITNLKNFKGTLMFTQQRALGQLSVNERSLIADQSGNLLSTGSGGVLERHDYMLTNIGSYHKNTFTESKNALYFFDAYDKKFYRVHQSLDPISDVKGVRTLIDNSVSSISLNNDDPYNVGGIAQYYDPDYNEVVLSFIVIDTTSPVGSTAGGGSTPVISTGDNVSLVYNEMTDTFVSRRSMFAVNYFNTYKHTLSIPSDQSTQGYVYLNDYGQYGEFFDTLYDSTVKVLINKGYPITKVYSSIEMALSVYDEYAVEKYDDFFQYFRAYNEYQNTDYVSFAMIGSVAPANSVRLTRRERNWTFQMPRNIVDQDLSAGSLLSPLDENAIGSASRAFRERLRSNFLYMDFSFNNNGTDKFIWPYIQTNFRISKR